MIEIVTHCYAEELPQYASMLRAHLSSFVLHPPKEELEVVVATTLTDLKTIDVVTYFEKNTTLNVVLLLLEPSYLWRRAIGRNLVAMQTKADAVWFCDADYLFGCGCIDKAMEGWRSLGCPSLTWPRSTQIHATHEMGDEYWRNHIEAAGIIEAPPQEHFVHHKLRKAIGGVQLASREYLKEFGYLNNTNWTKPVNCPFPDTMDDVAFRRQCEARGGLKGPFHTENLFRLRHSLVGYGSKKF